MSTIAFIVANYTHLAAGFCTDIPAMHAQLAHGESISHTWLSEVSSPPKTYKYCLIMAAWCEVLRAGLQPHSILVECWLIVQLATADRDSDRVGDRDRVRFAQYAAMMMHKTLLLRFASRKLDHVADVKANWQNTTGSHN